MRIVLSGSDTAAKNKAMLVLGALGPQAEIAVPDMIQAMADKGCRVSAIKAFAQIGPGASAAVPTLIASLRDEGLRADAMTTLGALGPAAKDAVPYLIDILQGKPEFSHAPPPPGYKYVHGEAAGEAGRTIANVFDQVIAKGALEQIGTSEALAAVKEYEAKPKN
jgi:HEAT repeat protein